VAEEVRKLPPKRGRRPKEYKEHAKKVRFCILLPHPPYLLLHPSSLLFQIVFFQVVGFILGSVTEKKKKQEGCAYLAWVAVNEEYQRCVH